MSEQKKIAVSIGMFDLFKGFAMICVIAAHTKTLFPGAFLFLQGQIGSKSIEYGLIGILGCLATFGVSLMPAFFVISGYGFRKRKIKKTIIQQAKLLLIPYFVTAIATIIFHFCNHYLFFRYLPDAIKETIRLALGFLLGLSATTTIGNYTIFSCGPVWFLLSMFWGWILFNTIENYVKQTWILTTVVITSTIGWGLSFLKICPWCIDHGMVSVFYYYLGYYIKKRKVFSEDYSKVRN